MGGGGGGEGWLRRVFFPGRGPVSLEKTGGAHVQRPKSPQRVQWRGKILRWCEQEGDSVAREAAAGTNRLPAPLSRGGGRTGFPHNSHGENRDGRRPGGTVLLPHHVHSHRPGRSLDGTGHL